MSKPVKINPGRVVEKIIWLLELEHFPVFYNVRPAKYSIFKNAGE